MSKRKPRKAVAMTASAPAENGGVHFRRAGAPVFPGYDILIMSSASQRQMVRAAGQFSGLAKSLRSAVHHSSPIYVKRNVLASTYIPHRCYHVRISAVLRSTIWHSGNAFLEQRHSVTGR